MHRRHLTTTILLVATLAAGCVAPPDEGSRADIEHHGVHLSPRAYQGADFTAFFDEAGEVGDTLGWSGDWLNLPREGTTPSIVADRANARDYHDVYLATFFDPDTGHPIRAVNNTTRDFYIAGAGLFAAVQQPNHMGLGVDVDKLWAGNRTAYDDFVIWYADAYATIKDASPTTQVFPVFNYEHVLGLRGGISNGTADAPNATRTTTDPLWHLLDDFPQRDLTAFSSYPGLYYRDPADVPRNHYRQMRDHADGPFAITEVAWHTAPWPAGWESNVKEQASFVDRLFAIAPPLELVLWKHLYDQPGVQPYDAMGLIDHDRTPRDAWHAFRAQSKPDATRDA